MVTLIPTSTINKDMDTLNQDMDTTQSMGHLTMLLGHHAGHAVAGHHGLPHA